MDLLGLCPDVLLTILRYCDHETLCKLRSTCKKFKSFIDQWSLQIFSSENLLISNLRNPQVRDRTSEIPKSYLIRAKWNKNWKAGLYREICWRHTHDRKVMPNLCLLKDRLWINSNRTLTEYTREREKLQRKPSRIINMPSGVDVNQFVCSNQRLVTAQSDGCLGIWNLNNEDKRPTESRVHMSAINAIDMVEDVAATGTDRGVFGLHNLRGDDSNSYCHLQDRIWTIAASKNHFAVGTSALQAEPLQIIDGERCQVIEKLGGKKRRGAGYLTVKWDDETTLYGAGYDSKIYKWDLRTPRRPVYRLQNLFGDNIYSLETDHHNSLLGGGQWYGRILLWDTRKLRFVQMYHAKKRNGAEAIRSPIYDLSFDARFLFAATDQFLNVFDFGVSKGEAQDYSYIAHESLMDFTYSSDEI